MKIVVCLLYCHNVLMVIFWVVTQCNPEDDYQCFGRMHNIHLQGEYLMSVVVFWVVTLGGLVGKLLLI
jgi:hypothetical protein